VEQDTAIATVGHAIQLSVAPVFLLSGIGAMLAVMTNRMARIVDRGRLHETRLIDAAPEEAVRLHDHLAVLSRRAKLINRAITLLTITALFVCAVVATLFIGAFLSFNVAIPVALLFVAAMATFFVALLFFLREIFLATASLRIGPQS
jgi:Protein of unknown function (DUF2721)